jgi:hypothetical protein
MPKYASGRANPELRGLIADASCALARLDRARLEELALSCQALNRSLGTMNLAERAKLTHQARDAQKDLAILAQVLDATRANLNVMERLRELRMGRIEYSERQVVGGAMVEVSRGDD